MSGPAWKLEDDLKTVTVTFPTDPPVGLKLDATQVEEILRNLGEFRALMQPPVPANITPGQKVEGLPDPAWYTEPEMLRGDSIFHLRDPRYGWLHYLIPRANAEKLAGLLQAQVNLPADAPDQRSKN